MKDFKLNMQSLGFLITELTKLLQSGKDYRLNLVEWREKRSVSQNALFHKWVGELSVYLVSKGRKSADEAFCKDLLKHTFLGYELIERTDALTGKKTQVEQLKKTSKLDAGEMHQFMNKCYQWCVDVGLFLTIPETSEYYQLMQMQDA